MRFRPTAPLMPALLALALLLSAAPAAPALAQTPAAPTDKFAWDQAGASLAEVSANRYELEIDGVLNPTRFTATCTGTTSPFLCKVPIPAVTPSTHTARARAVDQSVISSILFGDWSAPLSFRMRALPAAPQNLRIEVVPPTGADHAAGAAAVEAAADAGGEEFYLGLLAAPDGGKR